MSQKKKNKNKHKNLRVPTDREPRRNAHFAVEIRKIRWLPFLAEDVALLDITVGGLKIMAPQRMGVKGGDHFWVVLPKDLEDGKERFYCQMECLWANTGNGTLGAKFLDLGEEEKETIQELVKELLKRGKLAS